VGNVLTYDAGILHWAKKYPQETTLLGETPVNLEFLLDNDKFKAHLLSFEEFTKRINDKAIVVDVRDELQRDRLIFEQVSISVPIDDVVLYASKHAKEDKTLLLYDAVGKQVRWLQFYLEKAGITDYFFLKNGVKGYLDK